MNSKATLNAVNDDSIEVLGLCGESSARRLNYVKRLERPLGGAAAELQELRRPLIAQQGKKWGVYCATARHDTSAAAFSN